MTATFSWRQSKRSQPRVDEACLRTYSSHFSDVMEMLAPVASVSAYLDAHQEWFSRCAAPMTVQPLDVNAYRLQLGKFGNFGFEVEPKIDLVLLPQQQGVYRIETLPPSLPLDEGYSVDFQASLELCPQEQHTLVQWGLDLSVAIRLPAFIGVLPEALVQSSGDHLLRQIVRQISRRLTWKVQEDFHAHAGLACPPRRRALF